MVLDETLTRIISTIKEEVHIKFGVELGFEEIHVVIDNQLEATKLGFTRGVSVHWDRFCKFIYTDRKKRKIDTINKLNVIDLDSPDLTVEEKQKLRTDVIIKSYNKKKELIHKATYGSKTLKAKEVINLPKATNLDITLFTVINKKKR